MKVKRTIIPLGDFEVKSLVWCGDELVDWVSGGSRITLDGKVLRPRVRFSYRFDYAVTSQDGCYAAVVERLGTKGLLLKDGEIIRELNRSFYHANDYQYPIAFLKLPDGQQAIAHCPDQYCKIEIEEVESGKVLTRRETRWGSQFHSRLAVSPNNKYLLSAGWVWHPEDRIWMFEIDKVLDQPSLLDGNDSMLFIDGVDNATFDGDDKLIVTSELSSYDSETVQEYVQDPDSDFTGPDQVGVYDIRSRKFLSKAPMEVPLGKMMPAGSHVVGFYEHPKLMKLDTGRVSVRWDDLPSGKERSSIGSGPFPIVALDPENKRFAIFSDAKTAIVQFD